MTGFQCEGTPLGRGHIMALFLGGPDIPQNYAPQYEQWQQGGAWKLMEASILLQWQQLQAGVSLYMAVQLAYGNNGNTYNAEQLAFSEGEILDWTDARIPTDFTIWTFQDDADPAKREIANLQAASDATATAAMTALPGRPFMRHKATFNVRTMPIEDYAFWFRNLIRGWARERAKMAEVELVAKIAVATNAASRPSAAGRPAVMTKVLKLPSKLSRQDHARIERNAANALGFNARRSTAAWPLDNIGKVADFIRQKVSAGRTYGIRPAELLILRGPSAAAEGAISQALS